MPSATITSKGQLTLPKAIRDRLRLGAGDRVDFVVKDDGTVVMQPATVDVRELKDVLHRKGQPRVTGLDSNVLLRYLLHDERTQAETVTFDRSLRGLEGFRLL